MKVVFMGTSEFAVPCLEALVKSHDVLAVVTQPDRPKGRSSKPAPPPVKETARTHGLIVLQPEKIRTAAFAERLAAFNADIFVVASYGQILPGRILNMPKHGCFNVHASLLPRHRGASPIQTAIVCGDKTTGVTIMQMDKGLDTGDILLKKEIPINQDDTAQTLHDKLAGLGAQALLETLELLEQNKLMPQPQNNAQATYAPMLTKDTGRINWHAAPNQIVNLVRGLNPWPGAFTEINGQVLKVFSVKSLEFSGQGAEAGQVIAADKNGLVVACNGGAVRLTQIQPPGGKRMSDTDYLRGKKV